jgi:hypothetical protein
MRHLLLAVAVAGSLLLAPPPPAAANTVRAAARSMADNFCTALQGGYSINAATDHMIEQARGVWLQETRSPLWWPLFKGFVAQQCGPLVRQLESQQQ